MNRNGFTLVELLAVIIVLAVVAGIAIVGVNVGLGSAKKKTEDVFVKTLRDAINVYLETDGKSKEFKTSKVCEVSKTFGTSNIYESTSTIKFSDIINSTYKPLTANDMVNPANTEATCKVDAEIRIFRDDDYVYYYSFNQVGLTSLGCLEEYANVVISNLPAGCEL